MKRCAWLFVFVCASSLAQVSNPAIRPVTVDPSGATKCNLPWQYNTANGKVWYPSIPAGGSCTWTLLVGNGGTPGGTSLDASLYVNPQSQFAAEGAISCQFGVSPLADSWGSGGGSATPSTGNWPYYVAADVGNGNTDGQYGVVFPYTSAVLGASNSADFLMDAVAHWNPLEVGNPCAVAVGGLNNVRIGNTAQTYLTGYEQQWFGVDAWAGTASSEKLFANNSSQTTLAGSWTSPQYYVSYRSVSAGGTNYAVNDIVNLTGNSCSGPTMVIDSVSGGAVTSAHVSGGYSSTATCTTGSHTAAATTKNTCANGACTGFTVNTYVSTLSPEEETTGAANTATWAPYIGTTGVFYVYYNLYAASAGTFQITVGGVAATDTFSNTSTFSCQYPAGVLAPANLGIGGAQVGVLRFVTTPSSTPSVVFAPVLSGACGAVALVAPLGSHHRGATGPSIVHGLSQPEAQDGFATNRVLYDGYAILADQLARADGLNVHTVDIRAAIDTGTSANGIDFLASPSTPYSVCASSSSLPLHPDLCGYQHVAHALETGGMLVGRPGNAVTQINSPTSTVMCFNCGVSSSASGGQVRNGGATPAVIWSWDNFGDMTFVGFTKTTMPFYTGTQAISGCTLSAAHGGKGSGDFLSGTSGTCTITITPGFTATNGFVCEGHDLTTTTDILHQVVTGTPTTTASLSGTTVSGDFINWSCTAY